MNSSAFLDRRRFIAHAGSGLGGIALAQLLAADERGDPARLPHHRPRARNVLVLFVSGALSHVDTFDHKPELIRRDGRPLPGVDTLVTFQGENGALAAPLWPFRPRGACGKMTSDLLPHLGSRVDDLCFIHSMTSKTNTHGPAENFLSTGFTLDGFPSAGAWVTYALGSENADLPAFVAIPDPRGVPQASVNNWGAGFLPAAFQGTALSSAAPLRHLARPAGVTEEQDRGARALLRRLHEEFAARNPGDAEPAARIASYELAARMQLSVPEVTDLGSEPAHVLKLYGADDARNPLKAAFARNCILARRLIERGVRFVQLFNGAYAMGEGVGNWDGHKSLKAQYEVHAPILDQPAAALLADLKQRGLLEETLVLLCTEFGRMPTFQKGASGRDHNPAGFTCALAGAGVRAPMSYGATDAFGWKAEVDPVSVHDLHATVLHLLGLDHEKLTYYHNGIRRRLTDVHGRVVREILSA